MENKYYTPTIEEFYVGFEYEVMIPEKTTWSKEIFYLNNSHIDFIKYVDVQNEFTKNKIRIKYLNKEDIESLGWKFKKDNICELEFQSKCQEYYLTLSLDEKYYLRIAWYGEGDITRFSGTIKNKSELVKLLKELEIQ